MSPRRPVEEGTFSIPRPTYSPVKGKVYLANVGGMDGVPDYNHLPELIEFMTGPKNDLYWKAILKKPRQKSLVYFLTFTSNEKLPKESFKHAVVKQLEREIFSKVKYVFEHEDTNIHCHAYVTATHTINKDNFKSHIRKFGNMDIKHVKTDNGIEEYISKENTPITLK